MTLADTLAGGQVLAMVAEVVGAHGGQMTFERVAGEGFAVVLTLPAAQ